MIWQTRWVASRPSATHPERNEDRFWVGASGTAAAVIDGMGGYRRRTADGEIGGEHAAALAAEVLAERLDGWDAAQTLAVSKSRLREVIRAINGRIWRELNWSGEIPESENMEGKELDELSVGVAMTLIALCDQGSRAVAAQHGDTHGYVFKGDHGLIQITEDQDLLLWDRINGALTEEDAAEIAGQIDHFDGSDLGAMLDQRALHYLFDKNIFGALGVSAGCPETGWSAIKLAPGDRLALLTDGAYSNMSFDELTALIGYPTEPATMVVELAAQRSELPRFPNPDDPHQPFNLRATQDDMTVVILELGATVVAPDDGPATTAVTGDLTPIEPEP